MGSLLTATFVLVAAALTPGPNNLLVMAAGARGGWRAACPVIGGVILGGLGLLILTWTGLASAVTREPGARWGAVLLGVLYLGMNGLRLMRAERGGPKPAARSPHGWLAVAAFQLVNPKAWILALAVCATVSSELPGPSGLCALAAVYAVRSAFTLAAWAFVGRLLEERLGARGRRWLERALGGLLVLSALALAGLLR